MPVVTWISDTGWPALVTAGEAVGVMVGTVIQSQFLVSKDYPLAAALSAVLMLIILVMVLVYTKALGTEDLM